MTTFPISGGCICGSVRYTVKGPANCVVHCHCSQCRHGFASLVVTGATIDLNQMKIDKGEENLTTCTIPSGVRRQFCRTCGCSLFYFDDKFPEVMFYYPATLDGGMHPGHAKEAEHHVFVESKADWEAFEDNLPRHAKGVGIAALGKSE
ncbi:MAG: GFA family protein [Proteobacteria bacterium]|nr:GFA family protein [Pseudomonadota bacterium]